MIAAKGWAVSDAKGEFHLFDFSRRALNDDDVLIRIHFCGLCHSDIHEVQSDWGPSMYPLIPGHEITGLVEQIGSNVKRVQVGDPVGVGCLVDSCRQYQPCKTTLSLRLPLRSFFVKVKWIWNSIVFVAPLTLTTAKKEIRKPPPTEVRSSVLLPLFIRFVG